MFALVISNSRYYCLSSRAIQILIRSVKYHTESFRLTLGGGGGGGNGEQQMEVHIKQQKVDNRNYSSIITGL